MGLWAGVSVVTLVEFMEVLFALTCWKYCSRRARRKQRTSLSGGAAARVAEIELRE